MTNKELIDLMIKSTNESPYYGKLSKNNNLFCAIDLAKLCKDFADNGCLEEAMKTSSNQWIEVISELEKMIDLTH